LRDITLNQQIITTLSIFLSANIVTAASISSGKGTLPSSSSVSASFDPLLPLPQLVHRSTSFTRNDMINLNSNSEKIQTSISDLQPQESVCTTEEFGGEIFHSMSWPQLPNNSYIARGRGRQILSGEMLGGGSPIRNLSTDIAQHDVNNSQTSITQVSASLAAKGVNMTVNVVNGILRHEKLSLNLYFLDDI
jgi:hypothetical protein